MSMSAKSCSLVLAQNVWQCGCAIECWPCGCSEPNDPILTLDALTPDEARPGGKNNTVISIDHMVGFQCNLLVPYQNELMVVLLVVAFPGCTDNGILHCLQICSEVPSF